MRRAGDRAVSADAQRFLLDAFHPSLQYGVLAHIDERCKSSLESAVDAGSSHRDWIGSEVREAGLHYRSGGLAHGKADMAVFPASFLSSIKGVKRTLQKRPLLALHECIRWRKSGQQNISPGSVSSEAKLCFDSARRQKVRLAFCSGSQKETWRRSQN
jgi:hypothetical protein